MNAVCNGKGMAAAKEQQTTVAKKFFQAVGLIYGQVSFDEKKS